MGGGWVWIEAARCPTAAAAAAAAAAHTPREEEVFSSSALLTVCRACNKEKWK